MDVVDRRPVRPEGAALDNCLPVEPPALRADKMDEDALPSCRLPEDGHPGRVAAERPDVPLDPLQGCDLVEDTVIARTVVRGLVVQLGMGKEAESAHAVIGRDDDNPVLCKGGPVIDRHRAKRGYLPECPAIEEDHDRQLVTGTLCRGPDIEVQAVLARVYRRSW